jgi:hypothetical protein
MCHCLLGRESFLRLLARLMAIHDDSYLVVISQQLVEKVNCIIADKSLVVGVDKRVPGLLRVPRQYVIVLCIKFNIVLVEIVKQILRPQHLGNLHQLVRIAVPVEKGLAPEDHGRKHGAQRPHVQRVVVLLVVDEQLGTFEVARRDADIVFGAGVVKLGKTPIDETELHSQHSTSTSIGYTPCASRGQS